MTQAGGHVTARALEPRIRVALETAVRTHVSTVTVAVDGRVTLTDPLTAALAGVHGSIVGAWTFAPELWETVNQDEVEWATAVLLAAWEAGRASSIGTAHDRTHPPQHQTGSST
jgi:hypothetical protein